MADEQKAKTTRDTSADPAVKAKAAAPAKGFAPITPDDDQANPVKVEVPKSAQEIAEEGTALGQAGAEATGGDAPVAGSDEARAGKRIWALDADQNVNLRQGGPGAHQPDVVEFGS